MTFYPEDYTSFIVTGTLYQSEKKFRREFPGTYAGALHALGINLWRGRVWGVRKNTGKRVLVKRVFN